MRDDAEIWQALLRAKGLTVAQLAEDLRTTRQHAHRLLTGKRSADARRGELDRALALGPRRREGRPLYAVAMLGRDGELELLPAGDVQPLYRDRELATSVAESFRRSDDDVCVVPVWPEYAWRRTVAFHAAWGSTTEPRSVFLVDDPDLDFPVDVLLDELSDGYAETVRLRAVADDPVRLNALAALIEKDASAPAQRGGEEPVEDTEDEWPEDDIAVDEPDQGEEEEPAEDPWLQADTAVEPDRTETVDPVQAESGTGPLERITGYLRHREGDEDTPHTTDPPG
jgi:hypothetical protein